MKKAEEKQKDVLLEEVIEEKPSEESKKKLDEYEQQVAVQKSKKKKIWNLIFFIFNILIVGGIILYNVLGEDFTSLGDLQINGWAVLILIALFGIIIYVDCLPIAYLVKKACKRSRFKLSFKTTIWGRYYDAVTPMATGGQPFQVTYLISYNVPSTSALSIPIAKMFFVQLTWFFISLVCLIVSFTNGGLYNTYVSIASYIGFVCNFVVLFVNFFLAVSKSTGRKIVVRVLKLLQKMKIVKDYEKQYKKTTAYIEDYQNIMIKYMKSIKDFLYMFITISLRTILVYTIPFLLYCALVEVNFAYYGVFFIMGVLIDLAASFIPLPGGSGMSEISFSAMFALYFPGKVVWALLLYRFFTYYVYLLMGVGISIYDFAYGKRKYQWLKKKRDLQAESVEFKQVQIQNFRSERAMRRRKQLAK